MGQIEDAFRDAADEVAQIKAQPSNRYWWLYGTIKKKNENGTLDVAIDGVTIQQVKATVSCMIANVGDRVIVLKAGPLMTCVDVIATSDEVKVPASSITGTLPESALPTASTTAKGIMQVGSGLTASDGIVSVDNASYVKVVEFYELDGSGPDEWKYALDGWYLNSGVMSNHIGDYSDFMSVSGATMTITKAGNYVFHFRQGTRGPDGARTNAGFLVNGSEEVINASWSGTSGDFIAQSCTLIRHLEAGETVAPRTYTHGAYAMLRRALTCLYVVRF